jgi:hypothetical protein
METVLDLIEHYREQINRANETRDRIQDLKKELEELQDCLTRATREINNNKMLLDWCILSGESPAEALLKRDTQNIDHELSKMQWFNMPGTGQGTYVYNANPNTLWPTINTLNTIGANTLTVANMGAGGAGGGGALGNTTIYTVGGGGTYTNKTTP